MNCTDAARLLHAHADGELELAESLAVEEHLEACAACRRAHAGVLALREAIARHAAAPRAPEALRRTLEGEISRREPGRWRAWLRSPVAVAAPGVVALALAGWMFFASPSGPGAVAPQRVVYHIAESAGAGAALRNLANHLQASPDARVVVVAHNSGVDFLLAGARDESGAAFRSIVREYRRRGVDFRVCQNTLTRRGVDLSNVIPEADIVPSGIAEIGRLQAQEGFAYMRL